MDKTLAANLLPPKSADGVNTARLFRALSDENRLYILEILKDGEHCGCELLDKLKICQSTLSHHMKILTEAEMVTVRKSGKWMYYTISRAGMVTAKQYLDIYVACLPSQESANRREN